MHLVPFGDTFTIYPLPEYLPSPLPEGTIEVETLPEGTGILRIDENGVLYRESNEDPAPEIVYVQSTPEQIQAEILMNTELLIMYKELGL